TDALHDRPHAADDRAIVMSAARQQTLDGGTIGRGDDADHRTILFRGYSTMPWAPAALSRGMRSRTVRSSMIVFTATHSSSLSEEIVGRWRAGRIARIAFRSGRRTLSIIPTRPCASIAALSSSAMFSSFVRFHESASAV